MPNKILLFQTIFLILIDLNNQTILSEFLFWSSFFTYFSSDFFPESSALSLTFFMIQYLRRLFNNPMFLYISYELKDLFLWFWFTVIYSKFENLFFSNMLIPINIPRPKTNLFLMKPFFWYLPILRQNKINPTPVHKRINVRQTQFDDHTNSYFCNLMLFLIFHYSILQRLIFESFFILSIFYD